MNAQMVHNTHTMPPNSFPHSLSHNLLIDNKTAMDLYVRQSGINYYKNRKQWMASDVIDSCIPCLKFKENKIKMYTNVFNVD